MPGGGREPNGRLNTRVKQTGYDVLKWAHKQRDGLTPPMKAVLVALASYADADGCCFPSMPRLADDTRYSERQCQRAVSDLVGANYLEASRTGYRGKASSYRLNTTGQKRLAIEKGDTQSPLNDLERVTQCHPSPRKRVTHSREKGDTQSPPTNHRTNHQAKQAAPHAVGQQEARRMPCLSDPPEAWYWLADRNDDGTPKIETGVCPESVIAEFARRGLKLDPCPPDLIGQVSIGHCMFPSMAQLVAEAVGIYDPDWRPDWRPLFTWTRDGIRSDTILKAIRRVATRPNYSPPRSLTYFDGAVREAATRQPEY